MIKVSSLVKHYAGSARPAVDHIDLHIREGEFLGVVGRSGSGKSTLLHILSSLIRPDSGTVCFQGRDICSAPEEVRNHLRKREFAVVFQQHHLLPYLTAVENVLLPFMDGFRPIKPRHTASASGLLKRVGLGPREQHSRPGKLSGGEQQRVAIARALASGARVLFADEPTGDLDSVTGAAIMELLHELNREGLTIVMVTHNEEFAQTSSRVVRMSDGRIVSH